MVYAQSVSTTPTNPLDGTGLTTLAAMFGLIMNIVLGVGIALTVIYLILGGIKYIMSQGDKKGTLEARDSITNAIIGFIVVIAAMTIRLVILRMLGGTSINTPVGI